MRRSCFVVSLLVFAACGGGGDDGGGDGTGGPDAAAAQPDGAPAPGSPDAMTPPPAADAMPSGPDATPGATATVQGTVTRSVEPQHGGVGNIYIAVFSDNPIVNMSQTPIAQALIEDVDMTAADASATFTVTDVPLRTEPYHFVAFLDDNGTVDASDPSMAGPDMGDLISMNGLAVPTVVVNTPGTVAFDLVLSFAFPF